MADLKFTTIPTKELAETMNASATTFKLNDILTWDQSTDLSASDFGDTGIGVFRSSDNKFIELFTFDPTTIADSEITILNRGLSLTGENLTTEISANKRTWIKGDTKVEIGTHSPNALQWLRDYIDGVAVAGAPDANTTTKGIVEEATTAEIDADTADGSEGRLFINPEKLNASKYGLRLPSADEKAGISGVSATNPVVSLDGVTQAADLQTQTTSTDTIEVGEADATGRKNDLYQTFTASKSKIRGFKLYKKEDTGSFTGTVTIALYADDSGEPTGSALATVTISNDDWLIYPSDAEFRAIFTSEYDSLTIGDTYGIQVTTSTSDNSNHINLGGDTSGGDGTAYYNNTADGWTQIASTYLYYKTMEGIESQVPKTDENGILPYELKNIQEFYSSGTWTKPSTGSRVIIELWGAGGSGAAASKNDSSWSAACGGGGGGEYTRWECDIECLNSTETVTIGAGGAVRVANNSELAGSNGGSTIFATIFTADGGSGGAVDADNGGGSVTAAGGAGGSGTTADGQYDGAAGGGADYSPSVGDDGESGLWTAGGGGSADYNAGSGAAGAGGTGRFGNGGAGATYTSSDVVAESGGIACGGGAATAIRDGALSSATSGAGGDGFARITVY